MSFTFLSLSRCESSASRVCRATDCRRVQSFIFSAVSTGSVRIAASRSSVGDSTVPPSGISKGTPAFARSCGLETPTFMCSNPSAVLLPEKVICASPTVRVLGSRVIDPPLSEKRIGMGCIAGDGFRSPLTTANCAVKLRTDSEPAVLLRAESFRSCSSSSALAIPSGQNLPS